MKSISHRSIVRAVLLLVLTVAGFMVAETPASARFIKFVDQKGLQSACAKAGGYFDANSGGTSYFCVNGGNAIICSTYKKHFCVTPALSTPPKTILGYPVDTATDAMVSIPCDPIFCKIYCGGRPFCTFGDVSFLAMSAKPRDFSAPPSLVTPVPGGSSGPAPAGVPVLE